MKITLSLIAVLIFAKSLCSQVDCGNAHVLQDKSTISVPYVNGYGAYEELWPITCLANNEHESYWFKFECTKSGTFEFICTPNDLGADFDFALLTNCPSCAGFADRVACSYVGPISPPGYPTGISSNPLATFGIMPQSEILPLAVNLTIGQSYYLLLDNISTNGVGFTIQFAGTSEIGPTAPVDILTSSIAATPTLCKNDNGNIFEMKLPNKVGSGYPCLWSVEPHTASINGGDWIVEDVNNSISVQFFKTGIYTIKCVLTDLCTGTIVNALDTFTIVSPCAFAEKGCSDGSNPKGLKNHTINIFDTSKNKSFSTKMILDSILDIGICDLSNFGLTAGKGEARTNIVCNKDNWRDGIRTSDLVAISRHILLVEPFSSPYQYLAADVTYDGKVSTSDMLELRKLILFNIDTFSVVNNWRFVPMYYFDTTVCNFSTFNLNPLTAKCIFKAKGDSLGYFKNVKGKTFMDEFSVQLVDSLLQKQNTWSWKAVKSGDVNCSVDDTALQEDSRNDRKFMRTPHRCFEAGEVVNFMVYAKANTKATVWEMGVKVDPKVLEFLNVEQRGEALAVDMENFGLKQWEKGEFRAIWFDTLGREADLHRSKSLFSLRLKVKQATCDFESSFSLDKDILPTKFYNEKGEVLDARVQLSVEEDNHTNVTTPGHYDQKQQNQVLAAKKLVVER